MRNYLFETYRQICITRHVANLVARYLKALNQNYSFFWKKLLVCCWENEQNFQAYPTHLLFALRFYNITFIRHREYFETSNSIKFDIFKQVRFIRLTFKCVKIKQKLWRFLSILQTFHESMHVQYDYGGEMFD